MNPQLTRAQQKLTDIEMEMRRIGLWASEAPSREALSSTMPFMYDTLKFQQWIQFVFLPRTQDIILNGGPLPANCSIQPLAEHEFKEQKLEAPELLKLIQDMDNIFNGK